MSKAAQQPSLGDIAVVLPTKNEAANIEGFLASLPPEVLLVVVDASSDDTVARIRSLRPRNTLVVEELLDIPRARERGASLARRDWLLFTDADIAFAPDYFERLLARRFATDLGGLFGRKLAGDRYRLYDWIFGAGQRVCSWVRIPAASGSNMLISRLAWIACGGFDPSLVCNEDSEIMWRVRRAGYRVEFAGELVVHERDDRRLARGPLRKLAHSLLRCTTLYFDLLPERLRKSDWGYWRTGAKD
ncbi:MAG: glycosyltransferase [Planctomycetota bacterium]